LENNWRQKSIENLEKDFWEQPPEDSTPLVDNVHRLRTIQINKLEARDIRLLIGQAIGLKYLIPLALDILHDNLLVDAELYKGDLLKIVINVDDDFWRDNMDLKSQLDGLLQSYTDEDKEKFRRGKFDEWT
jgi:hypothetical protein